MCGGDHCLKSGATQAIDGLAGDLDGKSGEQRGHPGDIPVVLARLVGAAQDYVIDPIRRKTPALHQSSKSYSSQVVRPDIRQDTSGSSDRGPHCRSDERVTHVVRLTLIFLSRAAKLPPGNDSGQVAEWLKAHAWKACVRQKRTEGSNPSLSVPGTESGRATYLKGIAAPNGSPREQSC